MELGSPFEELCYVRCAYCSIVLAVGVPRKRMTDTVTVKCGHCNSLSFLNPRPSAQPLFSDHHQTLLQRPCNFLWPGQHSLGSSSATAEDMIPMAVPFVMKPPEKKHRLKSAYNCFMREEIQRIKAAKPDIPHREAFGTAAKNWAKCDPREIFYYATNSSGPSRATAIQQEKRSAGIPVEAFDVSKQKHRME
uniref:YABBY protein n=1 Tax=Anoectochilus roxburghii TaxID=569774 RepID=A0AA49QC90_9ASPA|nr:YABBY protein [Anoectochilus roxburghii]